MKQRPVAKAALQQAIVRELGVKMVYCQEDLRVLISRSFENDTPRDDGGILFKK